MKAYSFRRAFEKTEGANSYLFIRMNLRLTYSFKRGGLIIKLRPAKERHRLMNLLVHHDIVLHKGNLFAVFVQAAFQNGGSLLRTAPDFVTSLRQFRFIV